MARADLRCRVAVVALVPLRGAAAGAYGLRLRVQLIGPARPWSLGGPCDMLPLSGIIYAAAAAAPHLARAYTGMVAAMSAQPSSVYAAKSF